jgi:hypothetical protein
MKTLSLFRDPRPFVLPNRSLNLSVALGMLMLAVPGFSQGEPGTTEPNAPSATQDVSLSTAEGHILTLGDRVRIYRNSIISPETVLGPAFGAAIGQWEDTPSEWREGGEGYGRRFASGLGRHVISQSIEFGFAAVDGEDPRYFRSQDRRFWARTRHAVGSTVVSPTATGRRIPAFSRFAGTYGAAFIANTWYPDSKANAPQALQRGSTALASSVAFHLLREFAPHFVRKLLRDDF